MPGLFHGLEIGKQALLTHQLSMMTIGHNMANVNTPGYSRQRVQVTTAMPIELATYNLGSGITAEGIEQIRDLFLTSQYRRENKSLGEWTYKEKTLSQIETFFSEPSSEGLGSALDAFWDSWSSLAAGDADSSTPRNQIITNANTLITAFHSLDRQLSELITSTDADIVSRMDQLNLLARQVGNLNRLIVSEELGGQSANDLRDQRDYLIDEMSQLVEVSTREKANGAATVYVSGLAIVENADAFELGTRTISEDNTIKHQVVWKNSNTTITLYGGELRGLLDIRDRVAPGYRERLDDMAATLINQVNALHQQGIDLYGNTGSNFFDSLYRTAASIRLDPTVENDSNRIAVSLSGEVGDNANALAIHDLRYQLLMASGSSTIAEYYSSTVGGIGVDTQEAKTFKGNYEVLIQQIKNSRESIQGVSLDEEMAQLTKMQHAYNAAARVITVMDEALGTVIQGMGVVGR